LEKGKKYINFYFYSSVYTVLVKLIQEQIHVKVEWVFIKVVFQQSGFSVKRLFIKPSFKGVIHRSLPSSKRWDCIDSICSSNIQNLHLQTPQYTVSHGESESACIIALALLETELWRLKVYNHLATCLAPPFKDCSAAEPTLPGARTAYQEPPDVAPGRLS
jgi:hypothetical protein